MNSSECANSKRCWDADEDALIIKLVEEHGAGNWAVIAANMNCRTGKQCRERYHNHLQPDIKKGEWTDEENEKILLLQAQYGNQWAKITKELPGRTDNAVKNRWHAAIRAIMKQKRKELKMAKNASARAHGAKEKEKDITVSRSSEAAVIKKSNSNNSLLSDDDEDEDVMEKDEKKIITPFPAFTAEDLYIPSANVTNGLARMNLSGLTNSIPLPKPIDANIFSNSSNFKMDTSSGTAPNVIKKVVKRGNTVMNTYSFNHFYEEEDIQELLHLTASETDSNSNMDTANIFPKSVMVNNVPSEITDDYLMKWSEIDSSCGTLTSDDCIAGGIDDVGLYPVMHHDRSMSLDLKKHQIY